MLSFRVSINESIVFRVAKGKVYLWTTVQLLKVERWSVVLRTADNTQYRLERGKCLELDWNGVPLNIWYEEPHGRQAKLGIEAPAVVGVQRDSFQGSLRTGVQ
jgi:hypothetical protein